MGNVDNMKMISVMPAFSFNMLVEDTICSVVFGRNQQMTGAHCQVHSLWRGKAHQTEKRQAQGHSLFITKVIPVST